MDYKKYYQENKTFQTADNYRFQKIIKYVVDLKIQNLLDVGCGDGYLLGRIARESSAKLSGVDAYESNSGFAGTYKSADITSGIPYENDEFDGVIFGEVIEHVPDPDYLISEIHRVLKPGGYLIISTPNMVGWANRILVPLGIQPLFTETSTKSNMGRRFRVLGQGAKVQGHLKIFTHRSLKEILVAGNFEVIAKHGVPFFFPFPLNLLDKLLMKNIALASDMLFIASKQPTSGGTQ